jgi:phosphotransferase system enzyme I (PtsP)
MEIIHRAQQCSVPIGVCGEMAGDPAAAVLLLAMGVDHLSMAAPNLLRVKWMIRSIAYRQAQWVLNQALEMAEAADVRRLLREVLKEAGLERLARTGV